MIISDASEWLDMEELAKATIVIIVYPGGHFSYWKNRCASLPMIEHHDYPACDFQIHVDMCMSRIGVRLPQYEFEPIDLTIPT